MSKLPTFIEDLKGNQFRWGRTDCGKTPMKWFKQKTGIDLSNEYKWKSHKGLLELIENEGDAESIAAKVADKYGFEEIRPSFAQKGDCVLFDTKQGTILGICDGKHSWIIAAGGAVALRTLNGRRAWRLNK